MKLKPSRFKKIVLSHVTDLESHRKALQTRPADVESIHRMRVSTRRLREALVFLKEAVDEEKGRKLIKQTRQIGTALGNCRSYDVSVELLKKEFGKRHREAVDFVTEKLRRERKAREGALLRELGRYKGDRFQSAINSMLEKAERRFERRWAGAVSKILEKRKDRLQRDLKEKSLASKEGIHDLRIGIKKLRYDLEVLNSLGHGAHKKKIEVLRKYQGYLGSWHDHEVLVGHLRLVYGALEGSEKNVWAPKVAFLLVGAIKMEYDAESFILNKLRKSNGKLKNLL